MGRIQFRRARLQTPNSVSFGPHRVPGRELSEFLPVYHLCAKANSPSFLQNSPSFAPKLCEAQWVRFSENGTLETVFRPFPILDPLQDIAKNPVLTHFSEALIIRLDGGQILTTIRFVLLCSAFSISFLSGSEKVQNEKAPNFSNFLPEVWSEFSPWLFVLCFLGTGDHKNSPKIPAIFNAKSPGEVKEKNHKSILESRQLNFFFWRVPNPPGANPFVAERAFPTSDYWGRTGVARSAEEMTGICRDFQ